jgi:hypothetical protein
MKVVRIRVTGKIAGVARVFPYEHKVNVEEIPLYRVPTYEVRVNENRVFKAIRFGFRGHFERPWDPYRQCDEGIVAQHEVVSEWNGGYSPHSFGQGNGVQGGFRIRSDQVYIHEGPTIKSDNPRDYVASGTLSCIEITSDRAADDWNRFVNTVAVEAGVGYAGKAVQAGKVLVTVEPAAIPKGLLVGRLYGAAGQTNFIPNVLPNWDTTTVPWSG